MNLKELSEKLEISIRHLIYFASNKEKFYISFDIPKRNKLPRTIEAPFKQLKFIQRKILNKILYNYPIHKNAFGFVPKKSIKDNAEKHINSRIILKLDLKDFFPTITSNRVSGLFRAMGFDPRATFVLTELTTFNKHLPQGAPTSPFISNILCFPLDKRLNNFAEKNGLNYSRYADDIVFSGNRLKKSILKLIDKVVKDEGFKLATDKTKFVSSKNRQIVTGVVVNKKPNLTREKRRILRAIIHNCEIHGVFSQNLSKRHNFKKYLEGWISYLNMFDSKKASQLKSSINKMDWTLLENVKTSQTDVEKIILFMQKVEILIKFCEIKSSFNLSASEIINLSTPCKNKSILSSKMIVLDRKLGESFTKYSQGYVKNKVSPYPKKFKWKDLIEKFLIKNCINPENWKEIIEDIRFLSNFLERHSIESKERELATILKKYGFKDHLLNYNKVWMSIINKTIKELQILINISLKCQKD